MTRRIRQGGSSTRATLGLILTVALFAAACTKEAPPTAERAEEKPPANAEPDEPSDDLELDEEDTPDRPVEELGEEELEAECYRGRREACDLLGH